MSIRITAEERVCNYFDSAPLAEAKLVFNIVKGKMKKREEGGNPAPKTRAVRKPRKTVLPTEEASNG